MKRRLFALFLCFAMILAIAPVQAFALEPGKPISVEPAQAFAAEGSNVPVTTDIVPVAPIVKTHVNPLFEDHDRDWDSGNRDQFSTTAQASYYYTSLTAVADYIRPRLESRVPTIVVGVVLNDDSDYALEVVGEGMLYAAMEHTGIATQGDYLLWHYDWCQYGISGYEYEGLYYVTYEYSMYYLSTAAEETQVTNKVNSIVSGLYGKSRYDQVYGIYDYLTSNVVYDDSLTEHSAHGALIENCCVCQGYASAFYRMALELGIDCRVIAGANHGWNIVQLDGLYYNLDATWDAGNDQAGYDYQYFLKCPANFTDHPRYAEYDTAEFHAAYPMAMKDYEVGCRHSYQSKVTAPTCTKQGYTTYTCTKCGDSYVDNYVSATGHKAGAPVEENRKDPTCTSGGWYQNVVYCTNCRTVLSRETITLQALGHSYGEWVYDGDIKTRVCSVCGYVQEKDADNPFDDVDKGVFYYDAVLWAYKQGITAGYGYPNIFAPDVVCTRGQVVTFLWRAAGEPEPTSYENPFKDVTESDYFYKAVLWAVENGITSGYGYADVFNPNGSCTRGQVATFLWRYFDEPAPTSSNNPFNDVASGAFYYDAVLWAVEQGITNGYGSTGGFAPDMACNRGQVVTFLYRAMN